MNKEDKRWCIDKIIYSRLRLHFIDYANELIDCYLLFNIFHIEFSSSHLTRPKWFSWDEAFIAYHAIKKSIDYFQHFPKINSMQ